jgi:cysteine desulfurase
VRRGTALVPLFGGAQEAGRRAGTESVAAIAGFGAIAGEIASQLAAASAIATRRDRLEAALQAAVPGAQVHGAGMPRLPNTLAIGFPGVDAAALVLALDRAGIAVSRGSACQSGAASPSHVLDAMDVPPELARGTIRLSLGSETSDEEIARAIELIPPIVNRALHASRTPIGVMVGEDAP